MKAAGNQILKKICSAFSISLLAFSILFQNQCYSGVLASSLICSCNHSSSAEKHSDDPILSAHKGLVQEDDANLPDCHRTKLKHSAHECTCKKGEERKRMISALFQMNLIKNEIASILPWTEQSVREIKNYSYASIFTEKHFRPPRFSLAV